MSVMYDAPAPWRICPSNVNGNSLNSSRPDSQHDDLPPIALGSSLHPLQHHPLPHYPTLEPYNDLHYHNSNVRYQHVIARPDTEAELEARKVYSKLLAYDKYRKHRDAYKKPSNKPWPDDVEFAFLRAIVRWPPTWRQRYHPQDLILTAGVPLIVEDMGIPLAKLKAGLQRNEVVSVYILRMTGQLRKRKQVSSHLQTLKAFVGNDTYLHDYLVSPDPKKATKTVRTKPQKAQKRKVKGGKGVSDDEGAYDSGPENEMHNVKKFEELALKCIAFDMSLCAVPERSDHGQLDRAFHTYTQSVPGPYQAPASFSDLDHCLEHYPELGILDLEQYCGVPIIAAEASLEPVSKHSDGRHDLSIKFRLQGPRMPSVTRVQATTTLFEAGVPVFNTTKQGTMDSSWRGPDEMCMYQIPFVSQQWAARLHRWGQSLARLSAYEHRPLAAKESRRERAASVDTMRRAVSDQLAVLNAVQEICVGNDRSTNVRPIMVIHWAFRQADEGEFGRTFWRDVEMQQRPRDKGTLRTTLEPMGLANMLQTFDRSAPTNETLLAAQARDQEYKSLMPLLWSPTQPAEEGDKPWGESATGPEIDARFLRATSYCPSVIGSQGESLDTHALYSNSHVSYVSSHGTPAASEIGGPLDPEMDLTNLGMPPIGAFGHPDASKANRHNLHIVPSMHAEAYEPDILSASLEPDWYRHRDSQGAPYESVYDDRVRVKDEYDEKE